MPDRAILLTIYDASNGTCRTQDPTIFGPGDTNDANLFLYGSANPVYYTDPTGLISFAESMGTMAIQSVVSSSYFFAFSGFAAAYRGVQERQTLTQTMVSWFMDMALGPLDELVHTAAGLLHAAEKVYRFVVSIKGEIEPVAGDAAPPATAGMALMLRWDRLRGGFSSRIASTIERHHVNQWAAFEKFYKKAGWTKEEAMTMQVVGVAADAPVNERGHHPRNGTEHKLIHDYLEKYLWGPAERRELRPTVDIYNRINYEAIASVRGTYTAASTIELAKREQALLGVSDSDLLDIPSKGRRKR